MTTASDHPAGLGRARQVTKPGLAARIMQALRAAKQAIDQGLDTDLNTGLAIERHLFAGLFATEDRTIGMTSFIENGPGKAKFVGK